MVTLAFYKARGTWIDRLIRWRTNSPYSHCELVIGGTSFTSSARDGGVRSKVIAFKPGHWDFIVLNGLAGAGALELFDRTKGQGYDWYGVLAGQTLQIRAHDRRRWWCSEWCAAAIGLDSPWRYSPGLLADVARSMGRQ